MVVQHNLSAMNANRQLLINNNRMTGLTEKLSSGYRINRAADDAAGLAMSEKMRRQIRGLAQASANAQDGISMVQSAEGAMNELHDMLQRGTELSVKAANGTLTDVDRQMVDAEIQQLKKAIDEVAERTVFNEMNLFPTNGNSPRALSASQVYHFEISYRISDGQIMVGSDQAEAVDGADGTGTGGTVSTQSVLANKIANELIPNAVAQIFAAFPSLQTATGSDTIDMSLDVSFLDGPGGTLAYAQYSYGTAGKAVNMLVKVDTSDFDDDDASGTGENAEVLESTIAHELMHSVMQYNLTDGMSGRNGESYPTWFKEGTAQLAGGGFPTNWNYMLQYYTEGLSSGDATADANIKSYLQQYTVSGRPYGHGYLACAYIGYLANGGTGAVTADAIADGMDKVFTRLLNGESLSDAIQAETGKTMSQIEGLFQNPDASLTAFVRELSIASNDGAGSVIAAGGLGAGDTSILGNSASTQAFRIDPTKVKVDTNSGGAVVDLQVGAEAGCHISVKLYQMDSKALGLDNTSVSTATNASNAITEFKSAVGYVSNVRSYYGAVQNRLEHTINNLDNVVENTTAAESRIRDTDMAKMMVEYANQNILLQAGQAMLTQANHQQDGIMTLLRG